MSSQIILTSLAIGIITILVVLVFFGQIKKAQLNAKYPPIGKLVDVGGYRLHLHCQGERGPSVVLDAGQGESSLSWFGIQSEIAKATRVCAYDRAGLGWSEPSPRPRTARVMAEELHNLLEKAKVPKPYVLVGASLGGLNARVYAHLYPEEVAGLVLLDAAHEEQYLPEAIQKALQQMAGMVAVMRGYAVLMVSSGLAAIFPRLLPAGSMGRITPPAQIDQALRGAKPAYMRASADEIKDVQRSHAEVREMQVASLGDIPILVIRHGKAQVQMMPEVTAVMEETNRRLQEKVANQSVNARLVVADESGHAIQMDQPELVVRSVLEVVQGVRGRTGILSSTNEYTEQQKADVSI
jgi:pimeloyl-ACP methyl ester carboxylesterase